MAIAEGPLLAIDTATSSGTVAVGGREGAVVEMSLNVRGRHSSALVPAIDHLLSVAGLTPADLVGVAIGSGPGSFTGIRIAGATAKGIVHALGLPLLSYSSLHVAAAGWALPGATVFAMFDARGRDLFGACYRFGRTMETVVAPAPMTVDEAATLCVENGVDILTGDAVLRHGAEIAAGTGASVSPAHLAYPRASSLLWLAGTHPVEGSIDDPSAWEPDYLRPSGAERIAQQGKATRGASEES